MARGESTKTHLENVAILPKTAHGDASADVALAVYAPDADPGSPGTPTFKVANDGKVTATAFYIGDAQIVEAELEMLDGITAGTVAASKAVVADANKDIIGARVLTCQHLDAGAPGLSGSVDVFPITASRGKLSIQAMNTTSGDHTTTIITASQNGAYTYTIPNAGASADFVMTAGAQTVAGNKTLSGATTFGSTVTGPGAGTVVYRKRVTPTVAQVHAGYTVLPAVTGLKYRLVDYSVVAVGGDVETQTHFYIKGTQGASAVNLVDIAAGALTRAYLNKPWMPNNTLLVSSSDLVAFNVCDANTAITLADDAQATTATSFIVEVSYVVEV